MGGLRLGSEGDSALRDVGAGDVDLQGRDVRRGGDALGDRHVVRRRRACDIGDDRQAGSVLFQPRQSFGQDDVQAGVLQSDGVEHARGTLGHSWHRVAQARLQSRCLDHDRSQPGEVEVSGVLLTESEAPGGRNDRIGEVKPGKMYVQAFVHRITFPALRTGPS